MEGLHDSGLGDEAIVAVQVDLDSSLFSAEERALLALAERLTCDPAAADVAAREAQAAGWSPQATAQAVFLVSYMNMVTRIADAFDLPPDETHHFDPEAALPWSRCKAP